MSEKYKRSSIDKKIVIPSSKNNNNMSIKNSGNNSKIDNFTINQKFKKAQSINILNNPHKIIEKKQIKKKNDEDISFHFSFKK